MNFPADVKYSKDHTWLKVEGETGIIGITEFAQSELGEIVYLDLPAIGKNFQKDEVFGSVEAVKTTSDLFMPASGEVVAVNTVLKDKADLVNSDLFGEGWLIKIKLTSLQETNALLNAAQYQAIVA